MGMETKTRFYVDENDTAIMSYPAEVLNELAPVARDMLGIPRDHYTALLVGFGYPEIPYTRGVQKERTCKIHRYSARLSE